ncbi:hypothetical protein BSL78_10672 [Apostichopus japonicus]|uniref:PDZ domain-containing protein n=1 Tax=Stichopus japonicus TaxID=307972 RepID=A0A2G8KWS7_STIJA|nr:hypothetical protein BSL78_10672 [Apostichopus japonicus]
MGISNSKISKGDRRGSLRGVHPTKPEELVRYGATLIIKSKGRRNRRFVFEEVTDGGIVHSAGIREKDELISVNQIQLNKKSTVESILEIIRGGNFVMLEFRRKLQKETVPFIAMFNVTMEGDYPVIHQFGFYWRTPLSEWKEVLCPLFQLAIFKTSPPIMGDDRRLVIPNKSDITCQHKSGASRSASASQVRIVYDKTNSSLHYLPNNSPKLFLSDSPGTSVRCTIETLYQNRQLNPYDVNRHLFSMLKSPSLIVTPGSCYSYGIFKMYKYIEQQAPNREVGVNFVPVDDTSKEIVKKGSNITIEPWNNSPLLPTDEMFILRTTPSSLYHITHEDANGNVTYWTVDGDIIHLGGIEKAGEFQVS